MTVLPKEHSNAVLMFGGRELNGGQTNDLYRFDVGECRAPRRGTWMWSMQPTAPSAPSPPPREGHTATIFRNYFVIFGGLGLDGLLNDIHALDLDTLVWSVPETSGVLPIRRHQHSSCTFSRNLVIFGGYSEYGDSENDVAGNRSSPAAHPRAPARPQSTYPSSRTLHREPCNPDDDRSAAFLSHSKCISVVLHKSIPTQIQQLILCISNRTGSN